MDEKLIQSFLSFLPDEYIPCIQHLINEGVILAPAIKSYIIRREFHPALNRNAGNTMATYSELAIKYNYSLRQVMRICIPAKNG